MSGFEFNKIFAAVLVAGITAMLAGFIADGVSHSKNLEKDAVSIENAVVASAGSVKKAAGPDPVLHLIASADIARGQKLSRACTACHSFDKGGPHKVGPNIWNLIGAPIAARGDYKYSDAMKNHGGAWGYAELNEFLWKPKKSIPGTKMGYAGLKKPEDRAAMIAWLRTLADSPASLPDAAEIAGEAAP